MASTLEVPSHRACAHCRSQKVRCIPDETNSDVCQRCARAGRPCVFTPLQKRKQRKRTDTRVAELEREMRAMRTALKQKEEASTTKQGSPGTDGPRARSTGLWFQNNTNPDASSLGHAAQWEEDDNSNAPGLHALPASAAQSGKGPALWPVAWTNETAPNAGKDIIDSGRISMATARQLFEAYRNELFPHYPMVAISPSTTADEMRRTKPVLFLAILAAAAGKEDSDLSADLDQEVLRAYATRSLVQSEKSMELVQALLISSVWYHPPKKFGQLKYYEYIHMAATMAMDIGIGSRSSGPRSQFHGRQIHRANVHPAEDINNPDLSMTPRTPDVIDTSNLESRRTILACYFVSAGVSLSLRRPNMLRASSYIKECVEYLDQSPEAIPTDRTIVAWVRLIMIAEEISVSFCYDDPGEIALITELRAQLMLKDYDKRLTDLYRSIPEAEMGSGAFSMMYYTVRLYLHEIALHVDHSPEDFRAPYQMGSVHLYPDPEEIPSQVLAESIAECISSAHALLNVFLSMDVNSLRAVPVFTYVRVSFAAFVLAKLCLSAATPGSRIGQILDKNSLKAESYMDRLILHVRNVVGPHRCRVPAIFLALSFKLRQWSLHPEIIGEAERETSIFAVPEKHDLNKNDHLHGIQGPRLIEQASSTETSPQSSMAGRDDQMDPHATSYPPRMRKLVDMTADSTPLTEGEPLYTYGNTNNITNGNTSLADLTTASVGQLPPAANQMDLDPSYFQILSDVNAFTEGGLTGLDNWVTQSEDLLNPMIGLEWQNAQLADNDYTS